MNRERRKSSVPKKHRKERRHSHKASHEPVAAADATEAATEQPVLQSPDSAVPFSPETEENDARKEHRKVSRKSSRMDEYKSFTTSGSVHKQLTGEERKVNFLQIAMMLLVSVLLGAIFVGTILYVSFFVYSHGVTRQPRFVSPTKMASFGDWMAVTGSSLCESVPRRMFDMNGTVGDAAVATMLCACVVMPHRCGLGGGFFAIYYNIRNQEAKAVVSREVAPSTASLYMYRDHTNDSLRGFRAVAVFGELRGYEALLNLTGTKVPWKELFTKAIEYADSGFKVNEPLAKAINDHSLAIIEDQTKTLKRMFLNTATAKLYKEGDLFQNKLLAGTLRNISENPLRGSSLSTGPLAEAIADDIQKGGSNFITFVDLEKFEPWVTRALEVPLSEGERLFTAPPPSGGVVTASVVSIIDKFRAGGVVPDDVKTAHRVVEAFKYAFAQRSLLGDPLKININSLLRSLTSREMAEEIAARKIVEKPHSQAADYGYLASSQDDHGSEQVCILGPNGDAIVVVSSINTPFGAMVASRSTGILLNNQMNDFSTPITRDVHGFPPAKANYIEGGKRPMSSLSPVIVIDSSGGVLFAGSATGGAKISSALSQVLMRCLWMNHTIKQAIDAGRLHNQLIPDNVVKHEKTADIDVLHELRKKGHYLSLDDWQGDVIALRYIGPGAIYSGSYDFRTMGPGGLDGGRPPTT